MKIKISKIKLNELLNFASLVINDASNVALETILLKTENNKLICLFSNYDTYAKYEINDLEIIEQGEIIIKFKNLKGIISKLQNEDIFLEKIDNTLKIYNSTFDALVNLNTFDSFKINDFNIQKEVEFSLKSKTTKEIEKKLFHSLLSKDQKTSVLNGINIDNTSQKGVIKFVTTDGIKASLIKLESNYDCPIKITIEPELIKLINKLPSDDNDEILFISDNNKIIAKLNNVTIISKLLIDNFPNIYNVFEIKPEITFNINSKKFTNIIEHGMYIVNFDTFSIADININNKYLQVKFASNEIGSSIEKVEINNFQGNNELTISINAKLLVPLLKTFDDEEIIVKMVDQSKPIIFQNLNNNFEELILPIRR